MRHAASLLAVGSLAMSSCGDDAPPPGDLETDRVQLADFDETSRRYLLEHRRLEDDLRGSGETPDRAFVAMLDFVHDENRRRHPAALDLALPSLLLHVLPGPPSSPLTVDALLAAPVFPSDAATQFLSRATSPLDPTGVRGRLLRGALERRLGVTSDEVTQAELAALTRQMRDEIASRLQGLGTGDASVLIDGPLVATPDVDASPWDGMLSRALLEGLAEEGRFERVLVCGAPLDVANGFLGRRAPVTPSTLWAWPDALVASGVARADRVRIDCVESHPVVGAVLQAALVADAIDLAVFHPTHEPREGVVPFVESLYAASEAFGVTRGAWRVDLSPMLVESMCATVWSHGEAHLTKPEEWTEERRQSFEHMMGRIDGEARVRHRTVTLPHAYLEQFRWLNADAVTDDFADAHTYDLVICLGPLRLYPQAVQDVALLNLRRVTRKGGVLLTHESMGTSLGQIALGWEFVRVAEHPTWRAQRLYRCVK